VRKKLLSVAVVVAAAAATVMPVLRQVAAHASTNTTVVLTFDDDRADQATAKALLDSHDMKGTFYINSNTVGMSGHLTWAQIQQYQADGEEIGGHTLDYPHFDLTTLTTAQATSQVCDDRAAIQSHRLTVTDFAYPFGAGWDSASVRAIVQGCGYSSARRASGLGGSGPYADSSPPADPWGIKTEALPDNTFSLATLEAMVTNAENNGGGVVTIVFHEALTNMPAFLDWLEARKDNGTVTKTMTQAINDTGPPPDTTDPTSTIRCDGAPCSNNEYAASMQVSLAATDNAGGSGVAAIRYTTDGSTPSPSHGVAYSTPFTLPSTTTVKYLAYDNAGNVESSHSQLVHIDAVAPTSTIACQGGACSSAWYRAPVQVSLSAADTDSGVAAIYYTTDGSNPTLASPVCNAPFTLSESRYVKYRAVDHAGNLGAVNTTLLHIDTSPPTVAIASPGKGAIVTSKIKVTAHAADDGSGVVKVNFLVDDKFVAADTARPYAFIWNAKKAAKGVHTLTAKAFDAAGYVTATSITVTVR
jgi:peptidoglycan/xylan/chitin deacetylase (PgdA/CDA1 family)